MCTLVRSSLSSQQVTERKVPVSLKGLNSSSFHLRLDKRIPGVCKCRKSVQTLAMSNVSSFKHLISTQFSRSLGLAVVVT